jgi:hypothetical protein
VSDNGVLRRIFPPKGEEVAGGWRRLHNEELRNLYSSPNIIRVMKSRRMRWARHVARMGGMRYAYKILIGNPEGRRSLSKLWHRREENFIRLDLREIVWEVVDWIQLALDR